MGIQFSHCKASWSYSGFMRFRERLAESIGMQLRKMPGFRDNQEEFAWEDYDDPIIPFLNHSDCDGVLTPEQCRTIAPRLREIISTWEDNFENSYDLEMAEELIRGMEIAEKENENLQFR